MEKTALPKNSEALKKDRGAFFTPQPIADYLADWAVEGDQNALVLDPSCGESVFLEAAGRRILKAGGDQTNLPKQVFGVDLHEESVIRSRQLLQDQGLDGTFVVDDFFALSPPDRLDTKLPQVDAVIGNPPFVRYQKHIGL
ncbi:MAG: adenine-specific DNA-methyltransferase, partial [Solirubrobacterales bacterium]|nr:adenine-specific DNA-methyltransferase [Solirubrobacterales bacterium]